MQDLIIFERVAREKSFSRAATSLHMAQPSVSQRMQALEAEVGRPLFARHRRGADLTEAGRALLPYVERMLGLSSEGVEAARAVGEASRIVMAAPPSINSYYLPPLIRALVTGGHDVSIDSAHSHEVVQMLLDGVIDAGFVLTVPGRSGVRQRLLCQDPIVCVAAAHHPLAGQPSLTLADVARHPVAIHAFARPGYPELRERLNSSGGGPARGVLKASPVETARALALEGGFVTFVPRMTVVAELSAGRLVTLPVTDLPRFVWDIHLVYRERKQEEPALRVLLAGIEQALPKLSTC